MQFFKSTVSTLQTLVVALGVCIVVWGVTIFWKGMGQTIRARNYKGLKSSWPEAELSYCEQCLLICFPACFKVGRYDFSHQMDKKSAGNCIMGNLSGFFENVNDHIGEIATQVGNTPGNWNPGVVSLIRPLSETVVFLISVLVLAFVMCYKLI